VIWRVSLVRRIDLQVDSYEFESKHLAVGFLMEKIFLGNYFKFELELAQKI